MSYAKIKMPGVQTRLNDQEEKVLLDVLRNANSLATSTEGEAFEKEFCQFNGSADAVAVSSCSSALELSAILSGIGPGDEVIVPAHTFVATAVPFARTGAKLRWADIDPDLRVISPASVEALVNKNTKVIVVVHLYGLTVDMDAIMQIADKHGLIVVEDCAQAPGALYKGRRVGSFGQFGCFSFHTHKNITTLGEGGMLTVDDPENARKARRLRWMGNWPFEEKRDNYWQPAMSNIVEPVPGIWPHNFSMGEPNCAVGRLLIRRLDAVNKQRQHQAERFRVALKDYPELSFQKVTDGFSHVYHLMAGRFDGPNGKNRDDLIGLLSRKYNLDTIVQYWPLYRTELFQKFGFEEANVPETNRYFDNMISFPWWSDMPDETIDDMAERVIKAIDELRG